MCTYVTDDMIPKDGLLKHCCLANTRAPTDDNFADFPHYFVHSALFAALFVADIGHPVLPLALPAPVNTREAIFQIHFTVTITSDEGALRG